MPGVLVKAFPGLPNAFPPLSVIPTLVLARVAADGLSITLTFSDDVVGNTVPTLSMSGGAVTATYVSGSGGSTFVFSLSRSIAGTETGTLDIAADSYETAIGYTNFAIEDFSVSFAPSSSISGSGAGGLMYELMSDLMGDMMGELIRNGVSSGSGIVLSSPTDSAASETTALVGVTTNTAAGTIYWVVTASATAPTAEQIQAGEDHTGSAAVDSGSASATAGVNLDGPTGLTAATTYYAHFVQVSGSTVSNVVSGDGFTTLMAGAPTLTSPSGTATGETTADLAVTTNEANGTIYWVVTTSATTPSVAQIKAGQDHTGSAAVDSGNENPSTTGAQAYEATGLTAKTGYYAHFVHTDLETNNSTTVSSSLFTTLDETAPVLSSASGSATGITTADIVVTTNEADGTIYWVVTTSATTPSVSQIQAGNDHTGSAAVDSGNASVGSTGEKTGSVTGLTAATTYYGYWVHEDAAGNQSSIAATGSFITDSVTAPVLSSPTDVVFGSTLGTLTVSTDVANGTLYHVLSSSSTAPSKAQVKAGQDHTGSSALASGSQSVSATGTQTVNKTGLTPSTTYYTHFMHESSGGAQSNVSSADGFTTASNANLIPNGTFDSDYSGWTATRPDDTSVSGGVVTLDGTASPASVQLWLSPHVLAGNLRYRLSYDFTLLTGNRGTLRLRNGNNTSYIVVAIQPTASGSYTYDFTGANGGFGLILEAESGKSCSFDNVTVVPL